MGRISRLPKRLQPAALNLKARITPHQYGWEGDGYATDHLVPFAEDVVWARRYDAMHDRWFEGSPDVRWRMWLLTSWARHADHLPGAFAEFGSWRGGCAYMVLASTELSTMWLYDTFEGIPATNLTAGEREHGFAGQLAETSPDHVRGLLGEWRNRVELVIGDVFETVPAHDPGPLSLVHLDLNVSQPTAHVLPFAYERLVPGGVMVFDDYGWAEYADQRQIVDAFFDDCVERVIVLPTGQGIVTKL